MAREGLLIGVKEEPPEPSPPEPETPRKKAENFWYYHKWHILAAMLAVIILIFLIRDLTRPGVDYHIGMITSKYYPEEAVELLEENIATYAEDLNGDGRVMVEIIPYPITSEDSDPKMKLANLVKLDADLAAGTSLLFITDEESFETQQERKSMFAYTDGSTPQTSSIDQSRIRIPISELKALSGLSYAEENGSNLFDELGLSLRIYEDSAIEGQEDDYWNACRRLFQKLAAG
ncbi:MAG: DUF4350 domain-containing protein [Oscillospiraceae bacterium]|jgi:hypothetical protein